MPEGAGEPLSTDHLGSLPVPRWPSLYTMGYTGMRPELILATAEHLSAMIVDIRYRPYSRAPMWNQGAMRRVWGSRYLHVPELGNVNYRNPERGVEFQDLRFGFNDVRAMLTGLAFTSEFLRAHQRDPAQSGLSVILMCACPDVLRCHRRSAAEYIAQETGLGAWLELTAADVMGPHVRSSRSGRGGRGSGGSGPAIIQEDMFK